MKAIIIRGIFPSVNKIARFEPWHGHGVFGDKQ